MELWRLNVYVQRGVLYTVASAASFFIVGRSHLVTDVSYRDGKGVIFLSFLTLSCGVKNFVQEELLILTISTLKGKLRQNPETPLARLYLNVL